MKLQNEFDKFESKVGVTKSNSSQYQNWEQQRQRLEHLRNFSLKNVPKTKSRP